MPILYSLKCYLNETYKSEWFKLNFRNTWWVLWNILLTTNVGMELFNLSYRTNCTPGKTSIDDSRTARWRAVTVLTAIQLTASGVFIHLPYSRLIRDHVVSGCCGGTSIISLSTFFELIAGTYRHINVHVVENRQ